MAKFARHKSLAKNLRRSANWLSNLSNVKKVVLGLTENCRHKYPVGHIRILSHRPGGLKVNGYDQGCVVSMFIVVDDVNVKEIEREIEKRFKS